MKLASITPHAREILNKLVNIVSRIAFLSISDYINVQIAIYRQQLPKSCEKDIDAFSFLKSTYI